MENFIDRHLATIITALLGLLAWANEKRRKESEVDKIRGATFKIMQEAYETFSKDTNTKFIELKAEYIELKAELSLVRKELVSQKIENRKLELEIQALRNGTNFTSNAGNGKRKKL